MLIRTLAGLALAAPGLFAQTRPVFEAAEIHRSGPAMNPYTFISGGVLRGARYDLRKATMLDMIRVAWGVDPQVVLGGPNWLEFDRFDIAAKAPPASSPETVRLMLQSLLADRFKLVLHKDTRPLPAYALALGKSKPKITQAAGDGNPECKYQPQPAGSAFSTAYSCRNMTMAAFAERLHGIARDYLIDPVVDTTGLEGAWDFDLRWNSRSQVLPGGAERTTIFAAIEKQLGLLLTLQKAPAPVLVIDRVNEKPTDNAPEIAQKLPRRELEFEVADLKPSKPGAPGGGMQVTPGGGLEAIAMDMRVLLAAAWDIDWDHLDRFAGVPKWVEGAKFDIHAKASTNTNSPPVMGAGYIDDDVRLMLRALLIERFQMKVHNEDRPVNAYVLTAKPKELKMKKADPANRANCKEARAMANDPRDINPRLAELISCQNTTMAQFASQLQPLAPDNFSYPVADATGLNGGWDFTLSFTPSWMLGAAGPATDAGPGAAVASEPSGALSLADAIGKQLGLKLEMRKRMLPVVVIDHMEEKPLGN
ncbi:MAG TPA: TIGR03435 family protein [Bryobacteraceae bacterium]|nr:TIGR03435 family protein [Bryobacteraceae bacterium]